MQYNTLKLAFINLAFFLSDSWFRKLPWVLIRRGLLGMPLPTPLYGVLFSFSPVGRHFMMESSSRICPYAYTSLAWEAVSPNLQISGAILFLCIFLVVCPIWAHTLLAWDSVWPNFRSCNWGTVSFQDVSVKFCCYTQVYTVNIQIISNTITIITARIKNGEMHEHNCTMHILYSGHDHACPWKLN